ncbi:thioredoxin family protein, partial [Corynebacterium diphtheriae]
MHKVELMVRSTCGSCARVAAQIRPVVAAAGSELVISL